jgi:hypothetical protein
MSRADPAAKHRLPSRRGRTRARGVFVVSLVTALCGPLRAASGADPAAGEFDQIVSTTTTQNHDQACARMQSWIEQHPHDPAVARALLWMAQLRRTDRRSDLALPLLERAEREGGGEWVLHARKGIADLALEAHRYAEAITTYDELARSPSPLWSYVGSSAAGNARAERSRFYLLLLLLGAIAALSLSRILRTGLRALWPPPAELIYPLPILLLVLVSAAGQEEQEARAVITVALGSAVLLWLNGAWLRATPGRSRLGKALLGAGQAASLLYAALVWNGLWEKLMDTIAMGAG